jgi:hypothetical protein
VIRIKSNELDEWRETTGGGRLVIEAASDGKALISDADVLPLDRAVD